MRVYKGNAFTLALSLAFYSKPEYLSYQYIIKKARCEYIAGVHVCSLLLLC